MPDFTTQPLLILSVFYLAGEFARHLQRQVQDDFPSESKTLFTDGEVTCVQIAGLCHDLGKLRIGPKIIMSML